MSLQLRLTLGYTLVVLVSLLGMGVSAMVYFAQDLTLDFREDLTTLAEAHASKTLQNQPLVLQAFSASPIKEEIENPQLYLLDPEGRVLQTLPNQEGLPAIPAQALAAAHQGHSADFLVEHPDNTSLWRAIISLKPIPHQRRAVLYPFVVTSNGFQHHYLLMVVASDLATIRVLQRLRQSLTRWLLVGFGLALAIGIVSGHQATRPLREFAHVAHRVQDGELSARISNPKPGTEIGRLKRSLNTMLSRLQNLVEAQRRFTADAAHDLRTPLAVIKSGLDITLRRERSAEEYRKTLERVRSEVSRLIRLAEDLLMLSRLEAGQTNPFKNFFLYEALETILPLHTTAARNKGLSLLTQIPKDLMVFGDEGLVVRAASNLLANAVAYSAQGNLVIQAEHREGRVRLSVMDSGPGIPPAQREVIVERFIKGERSKGSGLGLSIVAQVARLHQGQLEILDRPGGGAVFVLNLPEAKVELTSS